MEENVENLSFGEFLKELRRERRLNLRKFSKLAEADPGNVSRIERGVQPPPQGNDILKRYAEALELQEGSEEWYNLFDKAAAEQGKIPKDLLEGEEIVKSLPVFFRTLRGERPTKEELQGVIEKIRNEVK